MSQHIRHQLAQLGANLTPDMMVATQNLFAELTAPKDPLISVDTDIAYGTDPRHRLDVFRRANLQDAPVLIFVHGGGFVGGDKSSETTPFHRNIGQYFAQAGMLAINMTYRLAPAHPWPAGTEDVSAAVAWAKEHCAEYGGDPEKIFVMGQSAGAVHVADSVARLHQLPVSEQQIAGAILVSCIYDAATAEPNDLNLAYYQTHEEAALREASVLTQLTETTLPLLMSVSEFDVPDFRRQAALLVSTYLHVNNDYPQMLYLRGHNHLSPVHAIGTSYDSLGSAVVDFMSNTVTTSATSRTP